MLNDTNSYPDLATAMRAVCENWCNVHGFTEPFCRNGEWWAFPPRAVMPVKIKDVMGKNSEAQCVYIGRVSFLLLPDGSFFT